MPGPRILIIEDTEEPRELMSLLLSASGCQVQTADDGVAGYALARRDQPDLVLCDLQMPRLDGFGVIRCIRSDTRLAAVPVIAVSAFAMRGDADKALAAGFNAYISKPFVPEAFVTQVRRFLPLLT